MTTNPDQPDRRPILGFVAGTPLLTPEDDKPVEELHPGDCIESGPDGEPPDDDQGDNEHDGPEPPRWWENN